MASDQTTEGKEPEPATSSAKTRPKDSLTPQETSLERLNKLPPLKQAEVLGRALERLRQKRLNGIQMDEANKAEADEASKLKEQWEAIDRRFRNWVKRAPKRDLLRLKEKLGKSDTSQSKPTK